MCALLCGIVNCKHNHTVLVSLCTICLPVLGVIIHLPCALQLQGTSPPYIHLFVCLFVCLFTCLFLFACLNTCVGVVSLVYIFHDYNNIDYDMFYLLFASVVKILSKHHIVKEKKVPYVKREREVLLKIDHPFFVKLYFTFQDKENLCILNNQHCIHVCNGRD